MAASPERERRRTLQDQVAVNGSAIPNAASGFDRGGVSASESTLLI